MSLRFLVSCCKRSLLKCSFSSWRFWMEVDHSTLSLDVLVTCIVWVDLGSWLLSLRSYFNVQFILTSLLTNVSLLLLFLGRIYCLLQSIRSVSAWLKCILQKMWGFISNFHKVFKHCNKVLGAFSQSPEQESFTELCRKQQLASLLSRKFS